jgi:DNA primase
VLPGKQPCISTPLEWDELTVKLKATDFTIDTISARLLEKGDLWQNFHDPKLKTANNKALTRVLEAQYL